MRASDLRRAFVTYGFTGLACTRALAGQARRPDADLLRQHTLGWADGLVGLWGIDVLGEGLERCVRDAPVVLVANHQSYVDVVALFVTLPDMPVFLAKRELERVPLFGRVMHTRGDVFVDRQAHEKATRTIDDASRIVHPGAPLLVFPEGTRAHEPVIGPFKKGAFHLARKAGAAIQPIGIHGSLEAWPRDHLAPRGGPVRVRVGHPISGSDARAMDLDALVTRARHDVAELAGLPLA